MQSLQKHSFAIDAELVGHMNSDKVEVSHNLALQQLHFNSAMPVETALSRVATNQSGGL